MALARNEKIALGVVVAVLLAMLLTLALVYFARRGRCEPATARPCACAGGASGQEVCLASGTAYSPCSCASSDAGTDGGSDAASDAAGSLGETGTGAPTGAGEPAGAGATAAGDDAGAAPGAAPSAMADDDAGASAAGAATTDGSATARGTGAATGNAEGQPPSGANPQGGSARAPRLCSAWSGVTGTCARCVVNFNFANARAPRDVFVGLCDKMDRGTLDFRFSAVTTAVRDPSPDRNATIHWQLVANDVPITEVREGPRAVSAVRQASRRMRDFRGGPLRVRVRLERCATGIETACTGSLSLVVGAGH